MPFLCTAYRTPAPASWYPVKQAATREGEVAAAAAIAVVEPAAQAATVMRDDAKCIDDHRDSGGNHDGRDRADKCSTPCHHNNNSNSSNKKDKSTDNALHTEHKRGRRRGRGSGGDGGASDPTPSRSLRWPAVLPADAAHSFAVADGETSRVYMLPSSAVQMLMCRPVPSRDEEHGSTATPSAYSASSASLQRVSVPLPLPQQPQQQSMSTASHDSDAFADSYHAAHVYNSHGDYNNNSMYSYNNNNYGGSAYYDYANGYTYDYYCNNNGDCGVATSAGMAADMYGGGGGSLGGAAAAAGAAADIVSANTSQQRYLLSDEEWAWLLQLPGVCWRHDPYNTQMMMSPLLPSSVMAATATLPRRDAVAPAALPSYRGDNNSAMRRTTAAALDDRDAVTTRPSAAAVHAASSATSPDATPTRVTTRHATHAIVDTCTPSRRPTPAQTPCKHYCIPLPAAAAAAIGLTAAAQTSTSSTNTSTSAGHAHVVCNAHGGSDEPSHCKSNNDSSDSSGSSRSKYSNNNNSDGVDATVHDTQQQRSAATTTMVCRTLDGTLKQQLSELWLSAAHANVFVDVLNMRAMLLGAHCNSSVGISRHGMRCGRAMARVLCGAGNAPSPCAHAAPGELHDASPVVPLDEVSYVYVLQHTHRRSLCGSCAYYDVGVIVVVDGDRGVDVGVVHSVYTRAAYEQLLLQSTAQAGDTLHTAVAHDHTATVRNAAPNDDTPAAHTASATQAASPPPPLPTPPLRRVLRARAYRTATASEVDYCSTRLHYLQQRTLLFLRQLHRLRVFTACRVDLMYFLGCEFQADAQKLYVYYCSPQPVRFLELATYLNHIFRCRIWIHEVSANEYATMFFPTD